MSHAQSRVKHLRELLRALKYYLAQADAFRLPLPTAKTMPSKNQLIFFQKTIFQRVKLFTKFFDVYSKKKKKK